MENGLVIQIIFILGLITIIFHDKKDKQSNGKND